MTDKAYIVANEQQEREVLEKFEQEGLKWKGFSQESTQWLPTRDISYGPSFPYILFGGDVVSWCSISELKDDYEIVFDGRKEEQMSDKYVVSQEFMSNLKNWKDNLKMNGKHSVYDYDIHEFSDIIEDWWSPVGIRDYEQNNRLIAILRWVNGEDVFEIEKPKKWVVRSKEHDEGGHYQYVKVGNFDMVFNKYNIDQSTRFDTKEEAKSWANSHQEVIEVKE